MRTTGKWALPGGRIEPDEDAAETVVREVREEIGGLIRAGAQLVEIKNDSYGDPAAQAYHVSPSDAGHGRAAPLQQSRFPLR